MTLNGTIMGGDRVWNCISALSQLHGSKASVPVKLRKVLMNLCQASKKEIEQLERDEEIYITNLKKRYWKTNEGRRDWFWWRMGKEDHEDLDDFVLGSETTSIFRHYKNSRLEWLDKVDVLHTLLRLDNIARDPVLVLLQDVNNVRLTVLEDFRKWDQALQHRLRLINWEPPRHPFNTPDIEKTMVELEDSITLSLAAARQLDTYSCSSSDTSSSSGSDSSGSLSPEFLSYCSGTSESDCSDYSNSSNDYSSDYY